MYYGAKWRNSAIWPRDLRWPWPQKRSPRAKDDAQICHRPESCRFIGCFMRLFPAFCVGKALNGNVKHFVWPDLWRHRWPRGQIFKLYLKDLVQAVWFFLPRLLVSEIDGGPLRPPPPQQRVGAGLGPVGRRLNVCVTPPPMAVTLYSINH